MFKVRKSIKRFRNDPAWTYRHKARDYLTTFDRGGYPFSLGPQGNGIRNLLQGHLHEREVSLFHLNAWKRTGGSNRAVAAWSYSVAVLTLPRPLPATAFTTGAFALYTNNWTYPAIPQTAGRSTEAPNSGTGGVRRRSTDPDFTTLIDTRNIERLTVKARIGWRIDGNRMIGWASRRRSYEDIQTIAETLMSIIADFPEQAWQWPETTNN